MVLFCLAEVSLHIILCADVWSLGEAFLRITAKPNTVIFLKCHILCAPLNQVTLLITFPLTTSSKGEKYPKELIPAGKALGFSVATILCFSLSFFFLFLDLPRTLLILNSWLALEVRAWWWEHLGSTIFKKWSLYRQHNLLTEMQQENYWIGENTLKNWLETCVLDLVWPCFRYVILVRCSASCYL